VVLPDATTSQRDDTIHEGCGVRDVEVQAPVADVDLADTDPAGTDLADVDLADVDLDVFVRVHGRSLLRCAYLMVGDTRAAEDIVQTALAKVLVRWDRVVAGGAPLPYVRAAVVRTALSARRRRWNGERPTAELPERGTDDRTDGLDARQRLRDALAKAPPRQRACVVLRHYEDLDEATTAAILGCSVGTVKSQTAKGLANLRRAMAAPPDDPRPTTDPLPIADPLSAIEPCSGGIR
jgi:RNA polymerase sigma-70 factor (sigma-E family)